MTIAREAGDAGRMARRVKDQGAAGDSHSPLSLFEVFHLFTADSGDPPSRTLAALAIEQEAAKTLGRLNNLSRSYLKSLERFSLHRRAGCTGGRVAPRGQRFMVHRPRPTGRAKCGQFDESIGGIVQPLPSRQVEDQLKRPLVVPRWPPHVRAACFLASQTLEDKVRRDE